MKIKKIILLTLSLLFVSCESLNSDKYFWTKSKCMPLMEEGNVSVIDIESKFLVGQYLSHGDITQKYKGKIKGAVAAVWKITRLKGGKPDFDELCGNEPKMSEFDENIRTQNEIDKFQYFKLRDLEYDKFKITRRNRNNCIRKQQKTAKKEQRTIYYYARTKANYEVKFPKKAQGHAHWQMSVYAGRVGDLTPEALTAEQLADTSKLRAHKCYRYRKNFGVPNKACYDLPGKDSSLYYTLRAVKYTQNNAHKKVYKSPWESILDVRISPPTPWTEIEGIEIDEKMYKHLDYWCDIEKYCNFDRYKGSMSEVQRAYVDMVKE